MDNVACKISRKTSTATLIFLRRLLLLCGLDSKYQGNGKPAVRDSNIQIFSFCVHPGEYKEASHYVRPSTDPETQDHLRLHDHARKYIFLWGFFKSAENERDEAPLAADYFARSCMKARIIWQECECEWGVDHGWIEDEDRKEKMSEADIAGRNSAW